MKRMKRFFGFLLFVVVVFACGCYQIDPGTMKELKGTYQLTEYSRSYPSSSGMVDLIEEKGITAYLIIDGSDYGYVVYRDNETELLCNCVRITYTYSQEDSNKIERIDYNVAGTAERSIIDKGSLGFLASKKQLNQQLPILAWENHSLVTKYTEYTKFTKVSKDADFSYVEEQLGKVPAYADYALAAYDGAFFLSDVSTSPYIYYVVDIDALNKKAVVYYALKSDGERTVLTDLDVRYQLAANGVDAETVSVGEKTFIVYSWSSELQEETTSEEGVTLFLSYAPVAGDVESFIQQAMEEYAAYPEGDAVA